MLSKFKLFALIVLAGILSVSCSVRLVDFTAISSKNVNLNVNTSEGVKTEGSKSYVFGFGFNIKDALDLALENAGPEYDMLMDGVVRYSNYFFVATVEVEGTAYNSRNIRTTMTKAEYKNWLINSESLYVKNENILKGIEEN
ncbi:hypothetical protein [Christiangramia antarctica]|nr:hypothetical protein [Gramella sp. AN32]